MTLDEWVEKTPGAILLKENLKTNLEVMLGWDEHEELEKILRLHLIMVRDFYNETFKSKKKT